MKTLGIEMVDAGFEVAVGRVGPDGGRALAERLSPPGTVPAVALIEGNEMHIGLGAEARRFLVPRQINDSFWEDVSLQPANLRRANRALSLSELSYHFLRHLIDGLPGVASEHESLVLALPATFTEGGDGAEERLGILLGICGDLELRLGAIVDAACAALLDPEAEPPSRGTALLIDLNQQAAVLTLVDIDGAATRRAFARIPGAGWQALVEQARRALSDRFLRQTSFDVSAERRTEQEFHDETLEALVTFTSHSEAWLRITSSARERAIQVPRDAVAADLRGFAESLSQSAVELLQRQGLSPTGVQMYLTARARHVCGLGTALRARGALNVRVLSPGAAARGAAALAAQRPAVSDLAEVPVESSLVLPAAEADARVALRAAFNFHRHSGGREAGPTHVVLDGIAHGLRAGGLRIAAGMNGQAADMSVPVAPVGIGPCEIVIEPRGGTWAVSAVLGNERVTLPGAETPLAAGDVLEVHGAPGAARLLFVRVSG